jgi:hypothetical protein
MGGQASKVTDAVKGATQQKSVTVQMTPQTATKFFQQPGGGVKKNKITKKKSTKKRIRKKTTKRRNKKRKTKQRKINRKKIGGGDPPEPDCECTGWKIGGRGQTICPGKNRRDRKTCDKSPACEWESYGGNDGYCNEKF